jgi:hypothetical protein
MRTAEDAVTSCAGFSTRFDTLRRPSALGAGCRFYDRHGRDSSFLGFPLFNCDMMEAYVGLALKAITHWAF